MRKSIIPLFLAILFLLGCQQKEKKPSISVHVSFDKEASEVPKDGRLLLMLSNNDEQEPRFQINDGLSGQIIFGMNIEAMSPGDTITFDESVFGYPYSSLKEVPTGEYSVQALLHTYETFNLSTGHTVKLPMDNGEGQQWRSSPGNLYSKPFKVRIVENGIENVEVVMDQVIPPILEPEDTEWIKHIRDKVRKAFRVLGQGHVFGCTCTVAQRI